MCQKCYYFVTSLNACPRTSPPLSCCVLHGTIISLCLKATTKFPYMLCFWVQKSLLFVLEADTFSCQFPSLHSPTLSSANIALSLGAALSPYQLSDEGKMAKNKPGLCYVQGSSFPHINKSTSEIGVCHKYYYISQSIYDCFDYLTCPQPHFFFIQKKSTAICINWSQDMMNSLKHTKKKVIYSSFVLYTLYAPFKSMLQFKKKKKKLTKSSFLALKSAFLSRTRFLMISHSASCSRSFFLILRTFSTFHQKNQNFFT